MAAVVTASWLKDQLDQGNPDIVILDVSWYSTKDAKEDFLKKHIAGAQWFHIMEDVTQTEMFPRNLPDPIAFQRQAQAVGVCRGSHVILYDNTPHCGYFVGSRAWWMFKLHGHDKVSVLEGGLTSWEVAGFPVTADLTTAKMGDFVVEMKTSWRRSCDDMVRNLKNRELQVCDTRAAEAYRGDPANIRSGHYPGAVNMTLATVLLDKENDRLQPVDKLQQIFTERGVDVNKPVVVMCGSGMSSCTAALAATLCGATDVSVFMGGFTEWSRKADDGQIEQNQK